MALASAEHARPTIGPIKLGLPALPFRRERASVQIAEPTDEFTPDQLEEIETLQIFISTPSKQLLASDQPNSEVLVFSEPRQLRQAYKAVLQFDAAQVELPEDTPENEDDYDAVNYYQAIQTLHGKSQELAEQTRRVLATLDAVGMHERKDQVYAHALDQLDLMRLVSAYFFPKWVAKEEAIHAFTIPKRAQQVVNIAVVSAMLLSAAGPALAHNQPDISPPQDFNPKKQKPQPRLSGLAHRGGDPDGGVGKLVVTPEAPEHPQQGGDPQEGPQITPPSFPIGRLIGNVRLEATTNSGIFSLPQGTESFFITGDVVAFDGYTWYQLEFHTQDGTVQTAYVRSDVIALNQPEVNQIQQYEAYQASINPNPENPHSGHLPQSLEQLQPGVGNVFPEFDRVVQPVIDRITYLIDNPNLHIQVFSNHLSGDDFRFAVVAFEIGTDDSSITRIFWPEDQNDATVVNPANWCTDSFREIPVVPGIILSGGFNDSQTDGVNENFYLTASAVINGQEVQFAWLNPSSGQFEATSGMPDTLSPRIIAQIMSGRYTVEEVFDQLRINTNEPEVAPAAPQEESAAYMALFPPTQPEIGPVTITTSQVADTNQGNLMVLGQLGINPETYTPITTGLDLIYGPDGQPLNWDFMQRVPVEGRNYQSALVFTARYQFGTMTNDYARFYFSIVRPNGREYLVSYRVGYGSTNYAQIYQIPSGSNLLAELTESPFSPQHFLFQDRLQDPTPDTPYTDRDFAQNLFNRLRPGMQVLISTPDQVPSGSNMSPEAARSRNQFTDHLYNGHPIDDTNLYAYFNNMGGPSTIAIPEVR